MNVDGMDKGFKIVDRRSANDKIEEPRPDRATLIEFKKWKAQLIDWIKRSATIEQNYDGTWTFLLPPKIVKLVWETTINERVKLKNVQRTEASEEIKKELEDAEEKMRAIVMVQVAKAKLESILKAAKDGKIHDRQAVEILVKAMGGAIGESTETDEGARTHYSQSWIQQQRIDHSETEQIRTRIEELCDKERLKLFSVYCYLCGGPTPCTCWRDE